MNVIWTQNYPVYELFHPSVYGAILVMSSMMNSYLNELSLLCSNNWWMDLEKNIMYLL